MRCENYLCWISRVAKAEFADALPERMQDLEWLATAGLRHQRAVAEISGRLPALPARFGTVFLSEDSLAQHVKQRKAALKQAFARVADADEWGIKIFATAKPQARAAGKSRQRRRLSEAQGRAAAAARAGKPDEEVTAFISALSKLAVATSPGRKSQRGTAGPGVARLVSHPPKGPQEAGSRR